MSFFYLNQNCNNPFRFGTFPQLDLLIFIFQVTKKALSYQKMTKYWSLKEIGSNDEQKFVHAIKLYNKTI